MAVDPDVVARIDATLLPQLDRHHLRLLVHCLDSFRAMVPSKDGGLPDAASRRRWCEQQPLVVEDPTFLRSLLLQLEGAGQQLSDLARQLNKQPLELTLDDLGEDVELLVEEEDLRDILGCLMLLAQAFMF